MDLSLNNPVGDGVLFSPCDLETLIEASRKSPRLRMMQPIQRLDNAPVQRLLNALQPWTYVRPHKHPMEGASETLVILQGALGLLIFDEAGKVQEKETLTAGCVFDLEPNIWHGMVCLEPDTVMAEFKKGPYDAGTDKEFSTWSPEEGSEEVGKFVESLSELFTSD